MSGDRPPLNRGLEAEYLTRFYDLIFGDDDSDWRQWPAQAIHWRRGFHAGVYFILTHLDDADVEAVEERIERNHPKAVARYERRSPAT